jgi:hypothetical protein
VAPYYSDTEFVAHACASLLVWLYCTWFWDLQGFVFDTTEEFCTSP